MFRSEVTAESLLGPLNAPQRDAVTTTKGPVLVLAGAGSGKTRVIAHRIAYLLGVEGVNPRSVIAVTFTNKAAGEMRQRVEALILPAGIRPPLISTFHSTCVRILRERSSQAGLPASFVIYDEDDRQALVKEAMRELDFDERALTPAAVVHRISHAKNQMLSVEDVEQLARTPREERIASLYRLYEERLHAAGGVDFDDLLIRVVRLLETVPQALDWYRSIWNYVLVDEYQDTNRAQYRIVQHADRGAPEPLRRRRPRPVGVPVARRRSQEHPRLREGLPGLPGDRARAELSLDQAHPRDRLPRHREQQSPEGQAPLDGERRGRQGGRLPGLGRERGIRLRRPVRARLAPRRRRLQRRRRLLPHECAVPGHGGRPAPRQHPLPDRGRGAVLRAARDQGRRGVSPPHREPLRRRGVPARGGGADPRCRPSHARPPGRARARERRVPARRVRPSSAGLRRPSRGRRSRTLPA